MQWYFTNALPKMLQASYPLSLLSIFLSRKARSLMFVALGFTLLYSFLAHKEVRFLFPTVPLWNLSAALAVSEIFSQRKGTFIKQALQICVSAAIVLGTTLTVISSVASYRNYPGGQAIGALNDIIMPTTSHQNSTVLVHIDTFSAMTGISRFLELPPPVLYSKVEGLNLAEYQEKGFDYLLNEQRYVPGYTIIRHIKGFDRVRFCGGSPIAAIDCALRLQWPLEFSMEDKICIHKLDGLQ